MTTTALSLSRRRLVPLAVLYGAVSWATVVAIVILTAFAHLDVSNQVWVRGVIVALTSLLTVRFAIGARAGRPRALLRLRIVSIVLLVAVVAVLFALALPAWMIAEQIVCGVILLALAVSAFRAR
jgi:hypothetical protein